MGDVRHMESSYTYSTFLEESTRRPIYGRTSLSKSPVLVLENSDFRELSRAPESSEQFVWLNRRYGETGTQLGRWAITPSIRADSSQDEVI